MSKPYRFLALAPFCLLVACSGSSEGPGTGSAGSTGTAGTTSAAGSNGTGGSTSTETGGATGTGTAGSTDPGGSTGTAGDQGTAGATGTGGTPSTGGGGSAAGATGTAGKTGTAGATGTGGATGTAGTTGTGGSPGTGGVPPSPGTKPTGLSAGCNMPPGPTDSNTKVSLREVHMTGLDPVYLTGGKYFDSSGKYDFTFRPYGLRLPKNYNPATGYAVTFGGGGCGGNASNFAGNPGGGLQIAPDGVTIQIGLSYLTGCFNDGGPSIGNRTDTPEQPYFRAVLADVEAHYCVDKSKVFVGGYSSGGWESYTLGCAAGDVVRGIGAEEGGLRTMHPPCLGPVAAVLVAGTADTENPIGPLDPNNTADKGAIDRLGSFGSAPGRDNILMRNGCIGNATTAIGAFDAKYTQCVKYTGCPVAYPVIWCALPGVGHNNSSYGGLNYSPGPMWQVLGSLPAP